jgi:hypothetical protein
MSVFFEIADTMLMLMGREVPVLEGWYSSWFQRGEICCLVMLMLLVVGC